MRQFDYDSISDVIVHMRYTTREDAGPFKEQAVTHLQKIITAEAPQLPLRRLFNLRHEFPTEWHAFFHPATGTAKQLVVQLKQEHFPFFAQEKEIKISAVSLFVKAKPAAPTGFEALFDPPLGTTVFTLASTQGFGKHLYLHTEKELDIAIDETQPWLLRIKTAEGDFNDLAEGDVEECFVLLEYSLHHAQG